jgi:antibiotic biosynthesis monooxygenase (ABM) superfamily enzyme
MALPLRTLLLSLLMVAALTWLVMPALSLICRGRLTSNTTQEST